MRPHNVGFSVGPTQISGQTRSALYEPFSRRLLSNGLQPLPCGPPCHSFALIRKWSPRLHRSRNVNVRPADPGGFLGCIDAIHERLSWGERQSPYYLIDAVPAHPEKPCGGACAASSPSYIAEVGIAS